MATFAIQNIITLMGQKQVNLDTGGDTLKMVLLSGITFDRTTMIDYADISSYELPTANGYTAGGATVSGQAITTDNVAYKSKWTCSSQIWNASGGSLVADHAAVYDSSVAGNPLVMWIGFGGTITAVSGQPLVVASPQVNFNC